MIGGKAPILVQSMTNTRDLPATIEQARYLESIGCELIRVAVPDAQAAANLRKIKEAIGIPLAADIHFDYRLALTAIDQGVDKLRINPGNIGSKERIREVTRAALGAGVPIRIGVNSGSLEKELADRYGYSPEAMTASALKHIGLLEENGFTDIVISLKASNVLTTLEAYQRLAGELDKTEGRNYPFHLGITEAGGVRRGSVKSALGLGLLLWHGLGDTIRVSLSGDPAPEIEVAYQILRELDLRHVGAEIIACPTCGRLEIDLQTLLRQVEELVGHMTEPVRIAVMGCIVNGIGEGKEADIGIAGGKGKGVIFRHGRQVAVVPEQELFPAFKKELEQLFHDLGYDWKS